MLRRAGTAAAIPGASALAHRDTNTVTSSLAKKTSAALSIRPGAPDLADHSSFHGTVTRAVGGASAGGLLAHVLDWVLPFADMPHLFTVGVTAGALAAVASRGKKWMRAAGGGGLGVAGSTLYLYAASHWPPFAAALLGASAAPVLGRGESLKRKAVTATTAAVSGAAGLYVGQVMLTSELLMGLMPGPLASAAAGAAAGLFFGLSAAPRHLSPPSDPVELAFGEALSIKDGELHDILQRALSIHQAVRADLAARTEDPAVAGLGQRVAELMLRALSIAEQCRRIEADMAATPAYELEDRMAGLRRKAEAASDLAARDTYLVAVASLDGQRRALEAIGRGRERVVARLHANLALLEKVRFSLLHLRSADAERSGSEISPVTEALEELSRALDATSSAVGEVFGRSGGELPSGGEAPAWDNVVPLPDNLELRDDRGRDEDLEPRLLERPLARRE